MPETVLDQESVVLDALAFEVPCEARSAPGHAAADVALVCRGCRVTWLMCAAHWEKDREQSFQLALLGRKITCACCSLAAMTLDDLVDVVPL